MMQYVLPLNRGSDYDFTGTLTDSIGAPINLTGYTISALEASAELSPHLTLTITDAPEAIAASRGEWPAPLAGFLEYLDASQSTDAQMEWAACVTVERMHPFVLLLASWMGLSDAQVDKMFGIEIE